VESVAVADYRHPRLAEHQGAVGRKIREGDGEQLLPAPEARPEETVESRQRAGECDQRAEESSP
jgi:hypothetical protein